METLPLNVSVSTKCRASSSYISKDCLGEQGKLSWVCVDLCFHFCCLLAYMEKPYSLPQKGIMDYAGGSHTQDMVVVALVHVTCEAWSCSEEETLQWSRLSGTAVQQAPLLCTDPPSPQLCLEEPLVGRIRFWNLQPCTKSPR